MSSSHSPALALSRAVLRAGIVLNLMFGAFVLVLLVASLAAEAQVVAALGANPDNRALVLGMRLVMVIGIGSVPFAYVVLTRLLAIVETVGRGDPFVAANAARLKVIAWCLLAAQLFHLAFGAMARIVNLAGGDVSWSFSINGWLAVVLLFVLARVFEEGTRMREELGTMI